MLKIKELAVSYGSKMVLENVSFTACKGEITTLIGKNGCGKSSIVSCINRMIQYKGRITVNDSDIMRINVKERARQLAILPQKLPSPDISVYELVSFGRSPYLDVSGRMSENDLMHVENAIKYTGIDALRHRMVNTLSGGEQQKAFFAMILAQDTDMIVLDEPTTYMDIRYEASFLNMISALKGKKTILMIMHDLTQAVRVSDRIVVIDEGSVKFEGKAVECAESGIIEQVFDVRQHKFSQDGQEYRFFSNF